MTYFRKRVLTIIGAKAFHGPVRDGKGWGHLAMVVRRNGDLEFEGILLSNTRRNLVKSVALTVGRRLGIVVTELYSMLLKIIGSSLTGN